MRVAPSPSGEARRILTQPQRSYPPLLLGLLAAVQRQVHALKAPRPYLLDRPLELRAGSLKWLQQQRPVGHQARRLDLQYRYQARWLNLLAE